MAFGDPSNVGGGGSLSTPVTGESGSAPVVSYIIGVSDFTFRVTCWGLKPNTLHKAYLLTKDVSIDCAPISNGTTYAYGSQLITDQSGGLVFDYHFKPDNSPYAVKFVAAINKNVAIIPVGQQLFKATNSDGSSYAQNYIESKGTVT